jgi:tetratricopeptide (TPR) repeat protein
MRALLGAVLLVLLMALCGAALAASQRDRDDCEGKSADRVIAGCTKVIEDRRESVKHRTLAYLYRAMAWHEKAEYDRVIVDADEALRLDPKQADAYHIRANAYSGKGEHARAIADYDRSIALDPDLDVFANRGRTYIAAGNHERGIADFDHTLKLDPKAEQVRYERCVAYHALGRLDAALEDCSEVIRTNPGKVVFDRRGVIHFTRGEFAKAIADFSAAMKLEPGRPFSMYGRGIARIKSGDKRGQNDIDIAKLERPNIAAEFEAYGKK